MHSQQSQPCVSVSISDSAGMQGFLGDRFVMIGGMQSHFLTFVMDM